MADQAPVVSLSLLSVGFTYFPTRVSGDVPQQGPCSVSCVALCSVPSSVSRAQQEEHRAVRSRAQSPAGGQDLLISQRVSQAHLSLWRHGPRLQE